MSGHDKPQRRGPANVPYLIAIVALAVAVVAWSSRAPDDQREVGPTSTNAAPQFPQPGSVAHNFALPRLSLSEPFETSDTVRLSDYAGQYVYLDVFGSWCLPCQEKYPEMETIADQFEEAGGAVVGMLLNDSPSLAASWFREQGGLTYPFVVLDNETSRTWNLVGAPMGFLIAPDGRIEARCVGCTRGTHTIEGMLEIVRRRRWATQRGERSGD